MQTHFLDTFFYPRSVAVVGATNNTGTLNYALFANLVCLNFPGRIYPVNPRAREVLGRKAYPDVRSIPDEVDLVVISIPAEKTLDVVRDCVAKKVKGVILVSGGFSEAGESGKKLQDEIRRLLSESGIRATGPNTLGPINSANGFSVAFRIIEQLPRGGASFIFQSGLYDPRLNTLISETGLFINKLIDLGNKMDINETDALEYLGHDPDTKVVAMHMESVAGDGRKFLRVLREVCREKPVVILKSARTDAGVRAASSHTAAIIRFSDAAFDAVIRQTGAIRAQTLDDLWDMAKAFEYLYPITGNRVMITTGSGGEGVLATDLCQFNGLTLAKLSPEAHERLREIHPGWSIPDNPFDQGVCSQFHDPMTVMRVVMSAAADDPNTDCVLMASRPERLQDPEEFINLATALEKKGKPFVLFKTVTLRGGDDFFRHVETHRIPVYPSSDRAIKALAALYRYGKWREKAAQG